MKTPIRYAGGKSKAIKIIGPYADGFETIVSPFIGGGSLEVFWATQGHRVLGYDIFRPLVNFWQVLLEQKSHLVEILNTLKIECYDEIKERLLCWEASQEIFQNWKTNYYKRDPIQLSNVEAAAYYFFNHNLSYGPLFLGWLSKNVNDKVWQNQIERIRQFECPNLRVDQADFADVIVEHRREFLYLDPPYFLEKDSDNQMFSGIYPSRNFPVHHTGFDHQKLCDLLMQHQGDFVLSYNNCETIRNMYSGFTFVYPSWSYSLGNGETRRENNVKKSHEILILSNRCGRLSQFIKP